MQFLLQLILCTLVRTMLAAGIALPPVEADPLCFARRLRQWGAGFVKPRFGALGVGVRRVEPGDPLPVLPATRELRSPVVVLRHLNVGDVHSRFTQVILECVDDETHHLGPGMRCRLAHHF